MNVLFTLVSRFYSLSLLAFPRHHRVEYGADMLDTFTREAAERHERRGSR